MKVIIDLIEDIRESINNTQEYIFTIGLLKEDSNDKSKLIYSGEATVNSTELNETTREFTFTIDGSDSKVTIGNTVPSLLILDMESMMYEIKVNVNAKYKSMEVVGFGKNEEEKRYILFIKI